LMAALATIYLMKLTWVLAAVGVLNAQAQFEVASIKPNPPGGVSTGMVRFLPGGRLSGQQVLLRFFIQNAYDLRPFQILGAPDWINSAGYDIEAKGDLDSTPDQMRQMMQKLLEDRFRMKAHRETREMPVYELAAAKGGPKLPEPKEESCMAPEPDGPGAAPPCGRAMVRIGRIGGVQIQGEKIGIGELIRIFSNLLGRIVIDKTGFTGVFDLQLGFALDDALAGLPHPPGPPEETSQQSIFVAVQRLGLKLESTKGPVEVLVIEHVEKPSAN
jgi:bla regulator protein blaR1